jgi:hypothetical protein
MYNNPIHRLRYYGLQLLLVAIVVSTASVGYSDDLPTLKSLKEEHVKSNNTQYVHNKINSFLAKGRLLRIGADATEEQLFRIYKKKPNKYRSFHQVTVRNIITTTENIYDGEAAISIISKNGQEVSRQKVLGDELLDIKREAVMDGPFLIVHEEGCLTVDAFELVEGVECVRLLVDKRSQHPYEKIWLRLDNFQEAKTSQLEISADGEDQLIEFYYSEFQKTKGTIFSQRVDKKINGELVYTTIIDLFETNYGIYNSFFKAE